MGQLEAYTMQDIYLVAIMSGVLSTYFAEEIEATIESVVSYLYSANQTSKKKLKLLVQKVPAGDLIGAMHMSQNFLGVGQFNFIVIEKPLDDRPIWQDLFLNQWTSTSTSSTAKLEAISDWNA